MRHTKVLLMIIVVLTFSLKVNSQTSEISFNDDNEKKAISNVEEKSEKEILGLWKLYKTLYSDGSSSIASENSFLNLVNDQNGRKFEKKGNKGDWILSFGNSDTSLVVCLLTTFRKYTERELKVDTYMINKVVENGTTYLMLTNISTLNVELFIRQL
jgi:hypothetical protein